MDLLNTGLQTTDKKLYLVSTDTRERLEIQFVPASISPARNVDVNTVKIIGRNTPKYQNTGGEDTLTLDLDFYADESNRVSVAQKCNWLKSLGYTNGNKAPAQRVVVIWGDLFQNQVWVVKGSVAPIYSNFNKEKGFMPQQAYVKLDLGLDVDYNLTWKDVMPDYIRGIDSGAPANGNDVTDGGTFDEILQRARERFSI